MMLMETLTLTMAMNFTEVSMMLTETLTLTMAMNFSVADDDADDVDDDDFFDTIDGDRSSEVCIKF